MKVIFLDIDGVIQPLWQQKRFNHMDEIEVLAKELDAKSQGIPILTMSPKKNILKVSKTHIAENVILVPYASIGQKRR